MLTLHYYIADGYALMPDSRGYFSVDDTMAVLTAPITPIVKYATTAARRNTAGLIDGYWPFSEPRHASTAASTAPSGCRCLNISYRHCSRDAADGERVTSSRQQHAARSSSILRALTGLTRFHAITYIGHAAPAAATAGS